MKKIKKFIQEKINNITKSVRTKLFFIMTLTIVSIIAILILANIFIAESYYLHYKRNTLLETYNTIDQYSMSNNLSSSYVDLELQKIAINNNLNIIITDSNNISIYNSSKDFSLSLQQIDKSKVLYKKDNIYIMEVKDSRNDINFLMLVGKLKNNATIYIRMPISSIEDSVKISNRFLYSIGIITVIISGIAILIISKRFAKPISELSVIANKMSKLDFSQKYRIKDSKDEIDNLGKSINIMSDKLEDTINQLQKNNIALEKDIQEKSKIDEMRKQFISDVSHELKTPIALIQGYSEGLIENVNTDEESRKFYAEVILDEANKMDKMVKELLELMKLEYGAKKINNTYFNITELIQEEIRKYTVMFNENEIEIKFNLKEPIFVYADSALMEQVLNNYISNGIKNIEEVNHEKYIKIEVAMLENKVRVCVFNTGKNISEENMQKIWDRFYKEDSSRNRELGGTGIGLSLVKAIMNNYHNEFGAINKENGVEFYFDINVNKL